MAIEDLAPFDRLNSPRAFDFSEEGERLRSAFEDLSDLSPEHLDDPIETFTSQAEPIESFSSQDNETDQNATTEKKATNEEDQNATTEKKAITEEDQNATTEKKATTEQDQNATTETKATTEKKATSEKKTTIEEDQTHYNPDRIRLNDIRRSENRHLKDQFAPYFE